MPQNPIPNYRIGNDLPISFFVEINSGDMLLNPDNTTVLLRDPYGDLVDIRWSISGTQVTGTFFGKSQKYTGLYTLKVVINKNAAEGMISRDKQIFRLVPHTWEADADTGVKTSIWQI